MRFKRRRQAPNRVDRDAASDRTLLEQWLSSEPSLTAQTRISLTEPAILDAFADLAEAVKTDKLRIPSALNRFGRRLAILGMLLEEVSAAVDRLAIQVSDSGSLQRFSAGVALSSGWSIGHIHGARQAECIDGLTGLATLPMLRLRLQQVAEQCAFLGLAVERSYCIVAIDTDPFGDNPSGDNPSGGNPFVAKAALIVIAERLRMHFNAGETISCHGSRVLVLTSNSERTRTKVIDILADLHSQPALSHIRVVGWVEELNPDGSLVEFLTGLTS